MIADPDDLRASDFDCLVVGAGLSGTTVARELAERGGRRVLVLEARRHVGGNAYDELDSSGVLIHLYGPHIFHTNNQTVFDYLSRFTDWNGYQHEVLANVHGQYLPVPFNKQSIRVAFGPQRGEELIAKLIDRYGDGEKVTIRQLRDESDPDLAEVADYVYRNVFVTYTTKQWGVGPDEVDPSVTARVPVFISEDCRYFQDAHQGLPADGYTAMVQRMLDHPNITVRCGIDARSVLSLEAEQVLVQGVPFDGTVVYTGPLDELFGNQFGHLPYRTIDFAFESLPVDEYQPSGTVNYTVSEDFTRITEFKHLTKQQVPGHTSIVREYPRDYQPDTDDEAYYPIIDDANLDLHRRYSELAAELPDFHAIGRLADYRYFNMDQVVNRALKLAGRLIDRH
ncbi:UDP-galactopyranose mutase [Nigerium massiliense]|uniref:UDP-galactopyranose mutase n=1 Tax=Nigerium massiliense TaxID=1522317 RepID=UPI0006943C4A|nr:UDP-galactopyranose mutase [Nigerium massiliense]